MTTTTKSTLTIEVDEASLDKIAEAFNASGPKKAELLKKYAEVAVAQFTDWITGEKRYRSLTGQYIDWIETIYEELLTSEQDRPSAAQIFNSFNMPYGQASYISRVLNEKELTKWRKLGKQELKETLKELEPKARKYIAQRAPERPLTCTLSEAAEIELRRLSEQLRLSDDKFILPIKRSGYGQFKMVDIAAESIIKLL
jgi:hypothetical protein